MAKSVNEEVGKGVTPFGALVWPHLDKPDDRFEADRPKFTADLRLNPEDGGAFEGLIKKFYEDFRKKVEERGEKFHKAKNELPVRLEEDKDTGEKIDTFIVKTKTGFKPGIFDSSSTPQPIGESVGAGSVVRLSFTAKGYNNGAMGSGISLQLRAVQVKELHAGGGEGGSEAFGEVEGGFVSAQAPQQAASASSESTSETGDF